MAVNKNLAANRKTAGICLLIIVWAVLVSNAWRLYPPDPDCVRAVSLYTEMLKETAVIGDEYTPLTTTLGNYTIKKSSENPIAAALMVRLLKDSGVSGDSVVAINASGSFPGFVLAALSACGAMNIKTCIIASIGASSYGANVPGNTIADILLKNHAGSPDYSILAITPGGSDDRGAELDPEELDRISAMLEKQGIPFIRPENLAAAITLRDSLFNKAGATLLMNIGGNHASSGADINLSLMSGLLKPDKARTYSEPGLIQNFLTAGIPVIQILNLKKLYAAYGLDFDQSGKLLAGADKLYRWKKIPVMAALLPPLGMVVLLGVFGYAGKNKRRA